MATYSISVQYANFESDRVEDRGVDSPSEILKDFDEFGWAAQVESANQSQKCSPTFSVNDIDSDRLFWISAYGDPADLSFGNQYTYQGEARKLFGLIRKHGSIDAPSPALSLETARRAIEHFVNDDHDSLLELLSR